MKKRVSVILILVAAVLGILSLFLLPANVIVQIGIDGQASNTMPKFWAIVLPFGLSVAGSVINMNTKEENNYKGLVIAVAGVAAMIACLFFNR